MHRLHIVKNTHTISCNAVVSNKCQAAYMTTSKNNSNNISWKDDRHLRC